MWGGGGRPGATLTWPLMLYRLCSYGRVYAAADPYHHTIGPAATYSIGTMVRRLGGLALGTSHDAAARAGGWAGGRALRRTAQTCDQCLGPGGWKDQGLDLSWRWGDLPRHALVQ